MFVRLSAVSSSGCYVDKTRYTSKVVQSNKNFSAKISFRGEPWKLNPSNVGVSSYGPLTATDAMKMYQKLKCGNYLDIGDDRNNFYHCNRIREENLSFLDRVTDLSEQKIFVEYYKNLTGFPNLRKVSENIENEFVSAIRKTSRDLSLNKDQVMQAGYDGVCSVGRNKALPGSDLDKAYVIIRGTGNKYDDIEAVNQFKGGIWFNTDQRILSYNHDEAAFPQVYTISQIVKLVNSVERACDINNYSGDPIHFYEFIAFLRRECPRAMNEYTENYITANPYILSVCGYFPKGGNDNLDINYPTRENIKNVAFVLEAMREGKIFSEFGCIDNHYIRLSKIYNLSNLSQLRALKQRGDKRPKRLAREHLEKDFDNWSTEKQYNFVKTLIKGSCGNNRAFTNDFPEYFSSPGQDLFAPLIEEILR